MGCYKDLMINAKGGFFIGLHPFKLSPLSGLK